jgi:hypothetical protein
VDLKRAAGLAIFAYDPRGCSKPLFGEVNSRSVRGVVHRRMV